MYVCCAMAKNKTFVLSDDSLNSHGFRTLTDGIDIVQFEKNPIMLFMHNRPWRGTKEEYSVIGRWENIRKENGQLLADAVFDLNDAFAKTIADKVDNNFLRMASIGFTPIEWSEDAALLVPGQTRATVTKSIAKEASIVDLGSNNNALALYDVPALYDETDKLVELSAGTDHIIPLIANTKTQNMELKDLLPLLTLADNATFDDVANAIKKQNGDLVKLQADFKIANDELTQLKAAAVTEKISNLVNDAFAAKKITDAEKPHYLKLAAADFESTEAVLKAMKPYESIEQQLKDNNTPEAVELAELVKLSGDTLFNDGKLDRLKALSPVHYKLKYKEAFGEEPKAEK